MPPNAELVAAVDEAGWSPGRLADRVNALVGAGYVARTTVVGWLRDNRLPRDPLPTVVAHLLSEVLGRPVDVRWLWQGRVEPSAMWVPANAGMDVPWHLGGIVTLMRNWPTPGGDTVDRRVFLAVSGAALTGPAWQYVDRLGIGQPALGGLGAAEAGKISHGMVDILDSTIRRLRDLDDREGGEQENLRFVHREFDAVAGLVRTGQPADSAVMARLLGNWAQLGQLAGWMAYDGQQHGLAQRYYRTALHAAHAAGDRALGAHILACMSYQATDRGRFDDAIQLAEAATEAAEGTPAAVRSLVSTWYGFALAAHGSQTGFRQAIEKARDLLEQPDALEERPPWLYWYDGRQLEVEAGQALVRLAMITTRDPKTTVEEAHTHLASRVDPTSTSGPRSSLFHGSWLARALVRGGDIEAAVAVGRDSLDRLKVTRSPRALTQLRHLHEDLATTRGATTNPPVVALRSDLREALARPGLST